MAVAYPWRTAWITGASSGIGRELALLLAGTGVKVTAIARSADKLGALAAEHANISSLVLDVADLEKVRALLTERIAAGGSPDLAVLNAGIWHPMGARGFDADKARESVEVNILGVTNCLEPLLAAMIARGAGHVGIVSSVAGYRGLPNSAAYAPTKAALINLAETLHGDLARFGVRISVINPGFVETPMTSVNTFPMPFIIQPRDAAERMAAGLAKGKFEIAFPWQLATMLKFARLLPTPLFLWAVKRFMLPRA